MNKKICILLCVSCIFLTSCNSDDSLDMQGIKEVKENIVYDNEMNTLISLEEKVEDKSQDKNSINKLLSNYSNVSKEAFKPSNIYLDYNYFTNPKYNELKPSYNINLYGADWKVTHTKNVDDLISSVFLNTDFKRSTYSLNDIVDKVDKITKNIFDKNGSSIYASNPNIDLRRDNSKLEDLIDSSKNIDIKDISSDINLYSFNKELEANRASFLFEGSDFYMYYIIYNNVFESKVNLDILYVSKNSHNHNGWLYSYLIKEIDEAVISYKGYSDIPMSYSEPDGGVVKYIKNNVASEEEKDKIRFTINGSSGGLGEETVNNLKEEDLEIKDWLEREMENRIKAQEMQEKNIEGDSYE